MTFETEEGIRRALEYNKSLKRDTASTSVKTWFENYEIEIHQAPEPSDIIWENRHFTPRDIFKK
jgi:hypothetical protein